MLTDIDLKHLRRCIELARKALTSGNPPFGSLLVSADGQVLFEDYNQVQSGDATHHPEMTLARWATAHLSPDERAGTTAYTSGEHCAMCSAAHGWVGLGASSTRPRPPNWPRGLPNGRFHAARCVICPSSKF